MVTGASTRRTLCGILKSMGTRSSPRIGGDKAKCRRLAKPWIQFLVVAHRTGLIMVSTRWLSFCNAGIFDATGGACLIVKLSRVWRNHNNRFFPGRHQGQRRNMGDWSHWTLSLLVFALFMYVVFPVALLREMGVAVVAVFGLSLVDV